MYDSIHDRYIRDKTFRKAILKWDALNRSSKRWISLQVETTFTKPLKKRLTFTVAIGGSTQMWHTSIRHQPEFKKALSAMHRLKQARTRRNMQHGHKFLLLIFLALAWKLVESDFEYSPQRWMTTDSTGQPGPWRFDIYLRKESQHAENSEFLS